MAIINGANYYAEVTATHVEGYGDGWNVKLKIASEDGHRTVGTTICWDKATAEAVADEWFKAGPGRLEVLRAFIDVGKRGAW